MTEAEKDLHPRQEGERDRIQILTDGMFAIVMTILVLALKPPTVGIDTLGHALGRMVPLLLVYFLTFLVLGGMWFRHRMEFTYISSVDRLFAWLNLGFLGFVALVPWSASLVGAHPGARLTVLVYNVNLAAATSLQHLGWLYATGRRRLVGAMPAKLVRWSRLVGLLPVVDYVVAVPVSLAYVSGLLYRLLYRLSR
jgi:uncharacterized membrane protein